MTFYHDLLLSSAFCSCPTMSMSFLLAGFCLWRLVEAVAYSTLSLLSQMVGRAYYGLWWHLFGSHLFHSFLEGGVILENFSKNNFSWEVSKELFGKDYAFLKL